MGQNATSPNLAASKAAVRFRLAAQSDDFSLKITRETDKLFWIRIELPASRSLVVTDFKTPDLRETEAALCLLFATSQLSLAELAEVRFLDIDPSDRRIVEHERHRLAATMREFSRLRDQACDEGELVRNRRKTDCVFKLRAANVVPFKRSEAS